MLPGAGELPHDPERPLAGADPNGMFSMSDGNYLVTEAKGNWVDEMDLSGHVAWSAQLPNDDFLVDDKASPYRGVYEVSTSAAPAAEPGVAHGRRLAVARRNLGRHVLFRPQRRRRVSPRSSSESHGNGHVSCHTDARTHTDVRTYTDTYTDSHAQLGSRLRHGGRYR